LVSLGFARFRSVSVGFVEKGYRPIIYDTIIITIATLPHQDYVLSLLQTLFSVSCKCVGSVIGRLKSRLTFLMVFHRVSCVSV